MSRCLKWELNTENPSGGLSGEPSRYHEWEPSADPIVFREFEAFISDSFVGQRSSPPTPPGIEARLSGELSWYPEWEPSADPIVFREFEALICNNFIGQQYPSPPKSIPPSLPKSSDSLVLTSPPTVSSSPCLTCLTEVKVAEVKVAVHPKSKMFACVLPAMW